MPYFFVGELFSVSLFLRTEKVWIKEGGASRFSVGTFLSHSTEKLHRGIFLCFRKDLVSKNFKEERGREYQYFPSKIFCLALPKSFVGESFSASIFSGIKKFYASERGEGVSRFSVKMFLPHGAEKFRKAESFSVSLFSCIKKFYASQSYFTIFDFLSNFFFSQCR